MYISHISLFLHVPILLNNPSTHHSAIQSNIWLLNPDKLSDGGRQGYKGNPKHLEKNPEPSLSGCAPNSQVVTVATAGGGTRHLGKKLGLVSQRVVTQAGVTTWAPNSQVVVPHGLPEMISSAPVMMRSYQGYYTRSHQNSEVKHLWPGIVLGWVTFREVPVLHPFYRNLENIFLPNSLLQKNSKEKNPMHTIKDSKESQARTQGKHRI